MTAIFSNTPAPGHVARYPLLNERLRGFRPGGMYVIAVRPGMGKSSLALGIAVRMALAEGRGLFWSGEMPAEELMGRAISAKCGLSLNTALTGMIERSGMVSGD